MVLKRPNFKPQMGFGLITRYKYQQMKDKGNGLQIKIAEY
jgi:hypothetical protein